MLISVVDERRGRVMRLTSQVEYNDREVIELGDARKGKEVDVIFVVE